MKRRLLLSVFAFLLALQGVVAQCGTIAFSGDDTAGCAPHVVKFTAVGFPAGSDFSWDFGTGYSTQSAADSTKIKVFNTVGFYTVNLKVILPGGAGNCFLTKTNYIEVTSKPTALFTMDKTVLCNGGDTVTFTDITAKSMSRDWLIDGVSYLNGPKTLKHLFGLSGYKSVSLTIRDSIGCSAVTNLDSAINILQPPVVNFSADQTQGCTPLSVTFTPNITGLSGQSVSSYSWTLTGSSVPISSATSPTVSYNSQGNYSVTLSITTNLGCTYTLTKTNYIHAGDPIAITFQANNVNTCRNSVVRLVNTTPGMPLPGVFAWRLPSGAIITQGDTTKDTVFVKFSTVGTYDIELNYTYNGCLSTKLISNYLNVRSPVASFSSLDAISCSFPDTVLMNNTSIVPSTGITSYSWIVYDTDHVTPYLTSTAMNPTFIINKWGLFDVRLIVSNTNGCRDTLRISDYLKVDSVVGDFSATPNIACPGQDIQLTDLTPLMSSKSASRYKWIFYSSDTINTLDFSLNGNDTISNPIVHYDTLGTYNITMITYNNLGCADTVVKNHIITIDIPTADFSVSDTTICAGSAATFNHLTLPIMPSYTHTWELQHTDSANITITGTGGTFSPTMAVPGIYNVKYKVTNSTYCSDSITRNAYLKVGGIKSNVSSNMVSGCAPLNVNFASSLEYNFHYADTANAVTYTWNVVPSGNGATASGYTINTQGAATTDIMFTQNGTYVVNCLVTNSDGCSYIDIVNGPITINVGIKSAFTLNPVYCLYDIASPVNTSLMNPVSYKWFSDANVTFTPFDNISNPNISFATKGPHTISLIATSVDGCNDTSAITINVSKPTADFSTSDTTHSCGPVLVNFNSLSSTDVTLFTWDFGDGSPLYTTTDTVISHIYSIIGAKNKFDVKLMVENADGCKDTILKTNYIKINTAIPYFKISNNYGCEPLNVHIVDSSTNVIKYYFNYGFGPADSTYIGDKVYTLSSPNALYSVYKPFLIVTDLNGNCYQIYQPADSIVVYSNPKAYFTVDNTNGCTPLPVNFTDTSVAATRWQWDFDNNGTIDDTTPSPSHTYTAGGVYSVRLVVMNQFGCTDTIIKTNYITASGKPVARFAVSDTVICPHAAVTFTDQSLFSNPIVQYHWDFGVTSTLNDTSDYANPAPFIYDVTGVYTVTLTIKDVNGCQDTLIKTNRIVVRDSLPPSQPQLYYITVVNDNDIAVIWNKNTAADFKSYDLYRSTGAAFSPLVTHTLINDTTYLDNSGINVKTQPYSYNIDASDICNYKTARGLTHRSIYLDATTLSQNSNSIKWTSYQGWAPGSFTYKLYRSNTYSGGYSLYAQLPDIDTEFVDLNLCDSDYYYYVEAYQPTTTFTSRSNIDFNHPPYYIPNVPIELFRATVINDKSVLIEWDTTGVVNTNKKIYHLDRMDANGVFQKIASVNSNFYIDNKVDVHAQNYVYQVRMEDNCGHIIAPSNAGKSIYFTLSNIDYTLYLNWTPYGDWANGIQAYLVEMFDNVSQTFKVITILPGTETSYIDNNFYKTDTAYCFRIRAIEDIQAIPDTSVSNIDCLQLPPKLTIPNAFSPNNDGINDIFYAQGVFIRNLTGKSQIDYLLRIYDRWGMLLFETNDLNKGWDGTFDHKACEVGVYVYEIRATGVDRHRFNYKGTFQLLR